MKSSEIRQKFLEFYKEKDHAIIPSAPLIPDNDPTTLFTGSGMQPLVPYLLGKDHPSGKRIVDSQKSFRAVDINDVGDNRHTTFFEMLGNWSFGDYFKEKQIPWVFEFLTKEVGIDPQKLFVTVFIGDDTKNIPRDTESAQIWKELFKEKNIDAKEVDLDTEENGSKMGMQEGRIFFYYSKNWWSRAGTPEKMPAGEPGGPCSEMFYEFDHIEHDPKFGEKCHPNCDCGRYLEIGNSVFMEYIKDAQGNFNKLPRKNVDFGGGLERIVAVSENKSDIFKIDLLSSLITYIEEKYSLSYSDEKITSSFRIIVDHIRSASFLITEGLIPGNTEREYVLRKLLRRLFYHGKKLELKEVDYLELIKIIAYNYKEIYSEIKNAVEKIEHEILTEKKKFDKVVHNIENEFKKIKENKDREKIGEIDGTTAFNLFQSDGAPIELITDFANEIGMKVNLEEFNEKLKKHQDTSRQGTEQKFKGGLADSSEMSLKYHTATHLLHQALHDVLGEGVMQKGSNITPERLRFDFSYGAKMTAEQKKKVEDIINEKIQEALPVQNVIMQKAEAEKTGAKHFFGEKYGEEISIYFIGNSLESAFSKEFCGGPHVKKTNELGHFKIVKEEAISQGVRRIKAILE